MGLRCDASPATGVGHLARCLALADELGTRAVTVTLLGRIDGAPWLVRAVADRGLDVVPAPDDPVELASLCADLGLDGLVLDGYTLDPGSGRAARDAGLTVLALRDGPFGAAQSADIHLEQNLGATPVETLTTGELSLAGVEFALLRDDVLRHRRDLAAPSEPYSPPSPPKVLAFFGGTDAAGAAPTVASLVLATALPLELTVVAATPEIADELTALELPAHQRLVVIAPTPEIAALAAGADLVVTASGSSVGELLAIGSPTAVLTVADNQLVGYTTLVEHGVVAPLGSLDALRHDADAATTQLRELLSSPEARLGLARRGRALVDGRGRERVADALLAAIEARPAP
ncbi:MULTISPECIES: PseG/SpsG family protein [unclassified Knoellia]|uniref:PseG/SpsG family protein n=1 Tax=Knoellia altitudinis TaxID=3404795 RepID=UPI003612AC1C